MGTEAFHWNVPLQCLKLIKTGVAAMGDQMAKISSAADSAMERRKSDRTAFYQKIIESDSIKKLEAVIERLLDMLEVKRSVLKTKRALLRFVSGELDAKLTLIDCGLRIVMKVVCY